MTLDLRLVSLSPAFTAEVKRKDRGKRITEQDLKVKVKIILSL